MTEQYNHIYECGNYGNDSECPACGSEPRDEYPDKKYSTVTVTCPGWYPEE